MFRGVRLMFVLSLAVALGACAGDTESQQAELQRTEESTTTSVATPDPFAPPSVIDSAYLDTVLAKLSELRSDVSREASTTKSFSPESEQRLSAMYADQALSEQLNFFRAAAPLDQPESTRRANTQYTTERILASRPDCVALNAKVVTVGIARPAYLGLKLETRDHDRTINPTPWVITVSTTPEVLATLPACV